MRDDLQKAIDILREQLGEWSAVESVYQPDLDKTAMKRALDLLTGFNEEFTLAKNEPEVRDEFFNDPATIDWIKLEMEGSQEYKNSIALKFRELLDSGEFLPEDAHDIIIRVRSTIDLAELVDYGQ